MDAASNNIQKKLNNSSALFYAFQKVKEKCKQPQHTRKIDGRIKGKVDLIT